MRSLLSWDLILSDFDHLYYGNYHGKSSFHSKDAPKSHIYSQSSAAIQRPQCIPPAESNRQLLITSSVFKCLADQDLCIRVQLPTKRMRKRSSLIKEIAGVGSMLVCEKDIVI